MRSVVLVILSAVCLAGLFIAYWNMQPASHRSDSGSKTAPALSPLSTEDQSRFKQFRPGENIWMIDRDDKGNLSKAFTAEHYQPQPDGTVKVTNPVAKFYLANNQHIQITGDTGNVVVKDAPDLARGVRERGPPAPPSRGRLHNVKMQFFDDTKVQDPRLMLTMTTNNVAFDNETFRITTEAFRDADGHVVADDQVPVHVTGDMEFDGRGLTVRWNDRDGRLELLEVAHGDVLKINDPAHSALFGGGGHKKATTRPVALLPGQPLPDMIAGKKRTVEPDIIREHPEPVTKPHRPHTQRAPKAGPVVYQAAFYDHVHITQAAQTGPGDQLDILADRMDVDFLLKESGVKSTTQPATGPASGPAPAVAPPPAAAQAESTEPGPSPAETVAHSPPPPPTTDSTSKPSEPPIIVHWTGILRVTPLTGPPPAPLAPGDSAVTLTGSPVKVHRVEPKQQGTDDVLCASLLYQSAGEKVSLRTSDDFPKILLNKTPVESAKEQGVTHVVSSGAVDYSRADERVLLSGPGTADIPLEAQPNDIYPHLQSAWTKVAEFDLKPEAANQEQASISRARFEGDVDIKHPRMALKGQILDLFFSTTPAAPAAAPIAVADAGEGVAVAPPKPRVQTNLRQAIVDTGVWCQLTESDGKLQTVECDRLILDTDLAEGKLYARHVNATGTVHAYGEDDLRAGFVDLLLNPAKTQVATSRPQSGDGQMNQVRLQEMVARDSVVVRSKEGTVAKAEELRVTTEDAHQHVSLISRDTLSQVIDAKGNVISGPVIRFEPDDSLAHVDGPGSLHTVQQAAAADPRQKHPENATPAGQPMDVTWAGRADLNGPADRIDVYDHVSAKSIDKKGFVDVAEGEHIRIDLRKKLLPATRPSTTPLASAGPATPPRKPRGPTTAPAVRMDLFKDKEVATITIEKSATVTSMLSDAAGGIEQQTQLSGPTIIIREFAQDGSPSRSLTVPDAGKMLIRDHRAQAKQPQVAQPNDNAAMGGAKGATAFQWNKQLVYTESNSRAVMTGEVLIVHQDDDPRQTPVRITADKVTAWLAALAKPDAKAKPDPKVKKPDAAESPAPQLKYLTAEGANVVVTRDAAQMIARRIDFDPVKHIMTALGTAQNPVVFYDGLTGQTTADRAEWDTITWNVKFTNPIFTFRPANGPPPPHEQKPPKPKKPGLEPEVR